MKIESIFAFVNIASLIDTFGNIDSDSAAKVSLIAIPLFLLMFGCCARSYNRSTFAPPSAALGAVQSSTETIYDLNPQLRFTGNDVPTVDHDVQENNDSSFLAEDRANSSVHTSFYPRHFKQPVTPSLSSKILPLYILPWNAVVRKLNFEQDLLPEV